MTLLPEPREIRRHNWRTPRPTIAQAAAADTALIDWTENVLGIHMHQWQRAFLHNNVIAHLDTTLLVEQARARRQQLTGIRTRAARLERKQLTRTIRTTERRQHQQAQPSSHGSWR